MFGHKVTTYNLESSLTGNNPTNLPLPSKMYIFRNDNCIIPRFIFPFPNPKRGKNSIFLVFHTLGNTKSFIYCIQIKIEYLGVQNRYKVDTPKDKNHDIMLSMEYSGRNPLLPHLPSGVFLCPFPRETCPSIKNLKVSEIKNDLRK